MSFPVNRIDSPEGAAEPTPATRVLVGYESSPHGRAALFHALDLARRAGVPLTVVSVATGEAVNVGCARCRQSAAMWNRAMRSMADEALAEAGSLVGPAPAVDYVVAIGRPVQAIGQAADRAGADVIVLPWEPTGRLRRLVSSTMADRLRRDRRWRIVVASPPERP